MTVKVYEENGEAIEIVDELDAEVVGRDEEGSLVLILR